jgi:hypothetical protein
MKTAFIQIFDVKQTTKVEEEKCENLPYPFHEPPEEREEDDYRWWDPEPESAPPTPVATSPPETHSRFMQVWKPMAIPSHQTGPINPPGENKSAHPNLAKKS